jgi:hypothetical protein
MGHVLTHSPELVKYFSPRVIVYHCGTDDLVFGGKTANDVVVAFKQWLRYVRTNLGCLHAVVYVSITITPFHRACGPSRVAAIEEANRLICVLAESDTMLYYVDTRPEGRPDEKMRRPFDVGIGEVFHASFPRKKKKRRASQDAMEMAGGAGAGVGAGVGVGVGAGVGADVDYNHTLRQQLERLQEGASPPTGPCPLSVDYAHTKDVFDAENPANYLGDNHHLNDLGHTRLGRLLRPVIEHAWNIQMRNVRISGGKGISEFHLRMFQGKPTELLNEMKLAGDMVGLFSKPRGMLNTQWPKHCLKFHGLVDARAARDALKKCGVCRSTCGWDTDCTVFHVCKICDWYMCGDCADVMVKFNTGRGEEVKPHEMVRWKTFVDSLTWNEPTPPTPAAGTVGAVGAVGGGGGGGGGGGKNAAVRSEALSLGAVYPDPPSAAERVLEGGWSMPKPEREESLSEMQTRLDGEQQKYDAAVAEILADHDAEMKAIQAKYKPNPSSPIARALTGTGSTSAVSSRNPKTGKTETVAMVAKIGGKKAREKVETKT